MNLFPFDKPREGQKDLIKDVETCLQQGKGLIANAPSGVGKTAAVLSVALSYALEHGKTVFFMTPKHSQHRIVVETLQMIKKKFDADFTTVDIIGKKWLCPVPSIDILSTADFNDYCNSIKRDERCIFYNSTKTRNGLSDSGISVLNSIMKKQPIHAEEMKYLCKGLCPYEIALELAKKSQIIICDYYHIFSPIRKNILFRINRNLEDLILIVDEAHNLPDRIRKILSGKISTYSLKYASKEATTFGFHEIAENINQIEKILKNMVRKLNKKEEVFVEKNHFSNEISLIGDYNKITEQFEAAATEVREKRKKSYIGSLARFFSLWEGEDFGYARILKREKHGISLNYICLDPVIITEDIVRSAYSTILMSGTLSPLNMYKNLFGFDENVVCNKYKSCFSDDNRLNVIIPDVTTQYTKRTQENFRKIAEYIVRICKQIRGNKAVFFPSYELRDNIYYLIRDSIEDKIFLEKQDMNKEEKMKLFSEFVTNAKNGGLLLGCQSGSMSEGLDYPGEFLKCVIIVGLPLSKPYLETQSLINYYDSKFNRGWEYGYIYPAMNRVIQSAGRCIRTETDIGVVVFMDKRFLWRNYRVVFPVDMKFYVTTEPEKYINEFLDKND